jgi:hypothetical protein
MRAAEARHQRVAQERFGEQSAHVDAVVGRPVQALCHVPTLRSVEGAVRPVPAIVT